VKQLKKECTLILVHSLFLSAKQTIDEKDLRKAALTGHMIVIEQ
jgi:hypothetical protein